MSAIEELFEEIALHHLKEHYPKINFYTHSGEIAGSKYIWINDKSNNQTYIYLTKSRGKDWCAVITTKLQKQNILTKELSILGFMVFDL